MNGVMVLLVAQRTSEESGFHLMNQQAKPIFGHLRLLLLLLHWKNC
jgi:hypothetical protein